MKKLLLSLSLITSLSVVAQVNTSSISFDGVDDYVSFSVPSPINDFTWMGWVNPTAFGREVPYILDTRLNTSQGTVFHLNNTNSLTYGMGYNNATNPSNNWVTVSGLNFNLATWHHVSLTYSSGTLYLYLNGTLLDSTTFSSGEFSEGDEFFLGNRKDNFTHPFNGSMDDMCLWNIALDSNQIQQYMNCPPTGSESGLLGYWNFEEGTGTTAADLTSNSNDGTLTNGPTWSNDVPAYNCNVGIDELSSPLSSIYPNPSSDNFKIIGIEKLKNITSFEITSITGARVAKRDIYSSVIDISSLDKGIYLFVISHENGTEKIRFIKD